MKNFLCCLFAFLGISLTVFVSPACAEAKFAQLPPAVASSMTKQRQFVTELIQLNFPGMQLKQTASDFAILQQIADKGLIRANQTWELQALGICFGDALSSYIPGLQWVFVSDEYGEDPILRYRQSYVQINALTMISKRIELGEKVSVMEMAEQTKSFLSTHLDLKMD